MTLRKVSNTQAAINRKLTKVYAEIAEEREQRCAGCGQYQYLSHSHIVRRGDPVGKKLETEKSNIAYHCLSMGKKGCHEIWENGTVQDQAQLMDFWENVAYISEVHPELYRKRYVGQIVNGIEIKD